jgi:hypothetical protein
MKRPSVLPRLQVFVLGAALLPAITLAGCASSLETAQKIHSYTPCGMMMDAVMQHPDTDSNLQTDSGTILPPAEPAAQPTNSATGESEQHVGH